MKVHLRSRFMVLMLSGFKKFEQQSLARFDPDGGWGGESYVMQSTRENLNKSITDLSKPKSGAPRLGCSELCSKVWPSVLNLNNLKINKTMQ